MFHGLAVGHRYAALMHPTRIIPASAGGRPAPQEAHLVGDVKEPCAPTTTNFVHLRGRGGADGLAKFQVKVWSPALRGVVAGQRQLRRQLP